MKYTLWIVGIIAIAFFVFFMRNEQNTPRTKNTQASSTEQSKAAFTIVAFGDSLTAGYGVELKDSYPAQLEKKLQQEGYDVRVINMGVSGETTTAGLDRVDFILKQKPDLVLLELGANDMLRGTPPSVTAKNIDAIVSKVTSAQVPTILLGMQSTSSNGAAFASEFNTLYPSIAKKYNIPLVPFFLEGVALNPVLNTQDGIHPNKDGYRYIIENHIFPIVKNNI